MHTQHDAIISLPQFWRTLAIVAIGFGVALALSWTIDAEFPHENYGASTEVHADASA